MANGLADNFWIAPKLFHYLSALPDYCVTAGIFACSMVNALTRVRQPPVLLEKADCLVKKTGLFF